MDRQESARYGQCTRQQEAFLALPGFSGTVVISIIYAIKIYLGGYLGTMFCFASAAHHLS